MPARFDISFGNTKVGQFELPGAGPEPVRSTLQRRADAPLRPGKAQEPADFGLFGDDSRQLDLVTLANTARKT